MTALKPVDAFKLSRRDVVGGGASAVFSSVFASPAALADRIFKDEKGKNLGELAEDMTGPVRYFSGVIKNEQKYSSGSRCRDQILVTVAVDANRAARVFFHFVETGADVDARGHAFTVNTDGKFEAEIKRPQQVAIFSGTIYDTHVDGLYYNPNQCSYSTKENAKLLPIEGPVNPPQSKKQTEMKPLRRLLKAVLV